VVKFAVLSFFFRFLLFSSYFLSYYWSSLLWVSAIGSITLGALGASRQFKIKRFIGYTSINQMGFILLGLATNNQMGLESSLVYLVIYMVAVIGFFSVLLVMEHSINFKGVSFIHQLSSLKAQNKGVSICFTVIIFSMAGIPPLAGF